MTMRSKEPALPLKSLPIESPEQRELRSVIEAVARPEGARPDVEQPLAKRVNYLPAPHYFNLNMACEIVNKSFGGFGCYLVGSCTRRRDYRDVDVRYIMEDAEFDRMFGGSRARPDLNPLWSLMSSAISLFLQTHSALPVDFQIQCQSVANAEFSCKEGYDRQPLGIFHSPIPRDYAASMADGQGAANPVIP